VARKLKTFITNLGFFELAIAAPSMKAALEAWGMTHNAFQQGFAKQTEDTAIVAATMAKPGVVLKRGVGTTGRFTEDAELPTELPNIKPTAITGSKPERKSRKAAKPDNTPPQDRAAIISFEKEKRKREEQKARKDAKLAKEREERRRATDKAQLALDDAREDHESVIAEIEKERVKLDAREEKEKRRWEAERKKLEAAIDRARQN
jgi:colicin import membrane protein